MWFSRFGMAAVALAGAALMLPGCTGVGAGVGVNVGKGPNYRHGPPDHAPAHGYRKKHHEHGVVMVYDSGLGVYIVAGAVDVYFHDDLFFRLSGHDWVASGSYYGPWEHAHYRNVPGGLRKMHNERRHEGDWDHDDHDDDDDRGKHKGKDKHKKHKRS